MRFQSVARVRKLPSLDVTLFNRIEFWSRIDISDFLQKGILGKECGLVSLYEALQSANPLVALYVLEAV